ncbi:MAG TPA: hypothetical protein VFJ58_03935 [Armatimonadota bacterium]|nr:hypothetical protein [Armatimonadota bacterium]
MKDRQTASGYHARLRSRRRVEFPDIRGKVEDEAGSVDYEVLQVSNGNVLVWLERRHPDMPQTASGGFGWVEPIGAGAADALDTALVKTRIERRLRSNMPANLLRQPVA